MIYVLLLPLLLLHPGGDHDFHLSKGEIRYEPSENSLRIMLHLFLDDLEEAMIQQGAPKTFLGTEKETPDAESHLQKYMATHFSLAVNGTPVTPEFLGREVTPDALGTYLYFEVTDLPVPQRVEVRYDALTELYADQRNLVRVIGPNGKFKVLLMHRDEPSGEAVF